MQTVSCRWSQTEGKRNTYKEQTLSSASTDGEKTGLRSVFELGEQRTGA